MRKHCFKEAEVEQRVVLLESLEALTVDSYWGSGLCVNLHWIFIKRSEKQSNDLMLYYSKSDYGIRFDLQNPKQIWAKQTNVSKLDFPFLIIYFITFSIWIAFLISSYANRATASNSITRIFIFHYNFKSVFIILTRCKKESIIQ